MQQYGQSVCIEYLLYYPEGRRTNIYSLMQFICFGTQKIKYCSLHTMAVFREEMRVRIAERLNGLTK